MKRVTVIFRSGARYDFECESVEWIAPDGVFSQVHSLQPYGGPEYRLDWEAVAGVFVADGPKPVSRNSPYLDPADVVNASVPNEMIDEALRLNHEAYELLKREGGGV